MRLIKLLFIACLLTVSQPATAAETQVRLVLSQSAARAGDTVLAGVHLRMPPDWHTYWRNPGASGMATKIEWTLPAGITAGDIQWPLPEKHPEKIEDADFTTYIYNHEVVLVVPLKLAADLAAGAQELKAKVSWLECKEQCLAGNANVQTRLSVGNESKPSPDAELIQTWQTKVPVPLRDWEAKAWWEKPPRDNARPLVLSLTGTQPATKDRAPQDADFFPDANDAFEVQAPTEKISGRRAGIALRKTVKKLEGDWPKEIRGVMVLIAGGEARGFEVKLPVDAKAPANAALPAPSGLSSPPQQSLWKMLLYAFLGGMILNIMPCVLPVIALKILGFIGEAHNDPRRVRRLGFVYGIGVLVSFLVLALMVIGFQAAGNKLGWGFQFSNPYFLVAMTVLVTLIAVNLFGIFEVTPGSRTMAAAAALSAKHGTAGAFLNGLLATLLATSCTAPLLGWAVGFAFAQPAPIILMVLLTVGAGLAFPYVVLSCRPGWLKFLPKPGAWMEKFKIAMGFPMLGAAIWLLTLVSTFYGERTWWLAVFLLFLALAAWVYGEFFQRGSKRRGLGIGFAIALLVVGYVYAIEKQLDWRRPVTAADDAEGTQTRLSSLAPKGYNWEPWSVEAVHAARSAGRPVVVDFTAKWCPNCQLYVKPALASASVRARLREINAVALLADYTLFPGSITDELDRHGQRGVPLVLVYPKDPEAPPIVLPEAFTPGIILSAIDRAVGSSSKNN